MTLAAHGSLGLLRQGREVLTPDTLAALDDALGDAPVQQPTPAPFARPGVAHR